jgi:glycosyltransferase involved in cell wall biosynthesis
MNAKMRVLVVSHGHPSFSIGGAEVASHNLFNGLNGLNDCEAHYLARVGPPVARHAGTALLSLRQKDREMLFFADDYDHFRLSNRDTETIERDFIRYVADVRPTVVHFHHFLGLGVECVYALRRHFPDIPIVVTLHEYLSICHHHGQMVKTQKNALCYRASPAECSLCFPHIPAGEFMRREMFLKTFYDQVDHFISPSRFLIDRYVEWGLPADKLTFLENGLMVDEIAPPRPLPRGGRRSRFAFFGQVTEFKGTRVLLEAISRIPDEVWGDDASVAFFGGNFDNQPEAFRKSFEDLLLRVGRRARFYGPYRSAELPRLMKDIDWVVVPSIWWENSPIVIQEAFLHGRPIISSNIGGMAEKVTPGVDGMHFRVGSVEDLVDRMTEALTKPELWDRLRGKCRRPINHLEAARQHVRLYRSLIQRRAAPLDKAG